MWTETVIVIVIEELVLLLNRNKIDLMLFSCVRVFLFVVLVSFFRDYLNFKITN